MMKVSISTLNRIPSGSGLWACHVCGDYWWEPRDCETCHKGGDMVASPQQPRNCRVGDLFGMTFTYHNSYNRHLSNKVSWTL